MLVTWVMMRRVSLRQRTLPFSTNFCVTVGGGVVKSCSARGELTGDANTCSHFFFTNAARSSSLKPAAKTLQDLSDEQLANGSTCNEGDASASEACRRGP